MLAIIINSILLVSKTGGDLATANNKLLSIENELEQLKEEDPYKVNEELKNKIKSVETVYLKSVESYEELLKLKESSDISEEFDNLYTKALTELSKQDYSQAESTLNELTQKINAEKDKITQTLPAPLPSKASNVPPGSGFSSQTVSTDVGSFTVSLIASDLSSTKVIVDTASEGDCRDGCPVLPLGDYVSRNGAFAGINGSYFCPAEYPSCAGKTNSFDTLLMNKNKVYFNSDNNTYSNVPAVIFGSGWIRFVSRSLEWGRDTGIDSMISNQPLLIQGNNITFGGDEDPKKGSRAGRSFVGNKGNTVYIGVVHGATVVESAHTLHALGMENALNLDSGGSTALWSGGYRVGPGRNIPNAILFVQK
ncbi:MAG: hypothetical protein UV74_C0013G0458 [Candidatus Woesebacteria bacterium GW2011_GWB1_43_14]|uniref:Phosphodiester glycosidase domain-containing protein n=1 Tax=Candidatus Woesebacteria bacterium GW2011_GWB1_43_14 TaxID=1618578 RepID=A0A0G1FQM5_9BACT|nr:MAG: hypothetical protein UT21_C0001G0170 [Candidatus Woesebacteria bacterium GW2011_GWA1_39_11b]KKS97336.1 MAG: hypothetical protein UV74_C0013G0458 [Candidatus Woesebacteria bacterium GW2011_GWB1_43_14]